MTIIVTDKPTIRLTSDELAKWQARYQQAFMLFAGKRPTLEEFIQRQSRPLKDRFCHSSNG